jgi:hypothetical protein
MAEGEPEAASSRISAMIPLRSRGASPATAFLIQLFTGRLAIVLFAIPFLYTAPIALTASLGRAAIAEGTVVVEPIGTFMRLAETAPLFALLPLLSIAMNAQVWLNQFGRDRRGLRTFFLLPFEPRELLAGRLRGLLAFTSLQTAIAAVPLLAIRRPGAIELVSGIAAGGVLLLVTTAVGHVVSILHPRAVEADSSTHIPLHLSWIAPATLLGTVAELAGLWFVFDLFVPGAGRAGLVLSLAAAIAAYRAALPRIAELLHSERERLLTM